MSAGHPFVNSTYSPAQIEPCQTCEKAPLCRAHRLACVDFSYFVSFGRFGKPTVASRLATAAIYDRIFQGES